MSTARASLDVGRHRVAVVNFTGFRDNWGCQATSWETVKWLQAALPERHAAEVFLVPLLPRCDVDAQLYERRIELGEAIHAVCDRTGNWRDALASLEQLCLTRYGDYAVRTRQSDLILFQAEGTMAGSDFLRGIRLLLLPFVAKHAWGIPVLSINQTLFSCDGAFSDLLGAVCNSFDWVAVRENASFSFGRSLSIRSLGLVPDFAFLTHANDHPDTPPIPADCFAVAGSAFHRIDRYERLVAMAGRIAREHGLRILIVASGIEQELVRLFQDRLPSASWIVLPPHLPYPAVAAALGRCQFLLSGRYHMNILAAAQLTPVIQLRGNSWKNEGLNGLLDRAMPVFDFAAEDAVADAAGSLMGARPHVQERLQGAVAAVHGRLQQSVDWLRHLLEGRTDRMAPGLQEQLGHVVSALDCHEPYRCAMLQQASEFSYPSARSDADLFGTPPDASQFTRLADQPDAVAQAGLRLFVATYGVQAPVPSPDILPQDVLSIGMPMLFSRSLTFLKEHVVDAGPAVPSFGRRDDLRLHALMLEQEFSGQSQLLLYHALLVVLIRRDLSRDWALERWIRLWDAEADVLCRKLDSRWLVSACDTILEHSSSHACRALAGGATLFVNTIKLYETERRAFGMLGAVPSDEAVEAVPHGPLHDGMTSFAVGSGDMVHNMYRRLHALCDAMVCDDEGRRVAQIVRTLLVRACVNDTVLRRFGRSHKQPETAWLPKILHFCGDSHLRAPYHAWQQGWFRAQPCTFTLVGGATAIGLRHPTSRTQALQAWSQALLPYRPDTVPVFQLGEVDCGFVIWQRAETYGESVEVQFRQSLTAYEKFLSKIREAGYHDLIVTSAMLPTIRDGQLDGEISHLRRDVRAGLAERTELTLRYNAELAAFCRDQGLRFVDFTFDLLDERSGLLHECWRHDDPADHHLHPERGGRLWVKRLTAALQGSVNGHLMA